MKKLLKDNLEDIKTGLLITASMTVILLIFLIILIIQMTSDLRDQVIDLRQQVQDERISHNTCKQYLDDVLQQLEP